MHFKNWEPHTIREKFRSPYLMLHKQTVLSVYNDLSDNEAKGSPYPYYWN